MEKLKTALKKMVNKAIDKEVDEWPPSCTALFHQPERPVSPPHDKIITPNSRK